MHFGFADWHSWVFGDFGKSPKWGSGGKKVRNLRKKGQGIIEKKAPFFKKGTKGHEFRRLEAGNFDPPDPDSRKK